MEDFEYNRRIPLPEGILFKKISLSEDGGEILIPFKSRINGDKTRRLASHFAEYLSTNLNEEYGIYLHNPGRIKGSYRIMPANLIDSGTLSPWELPERADYSVPFLEAGVGNDVSIIREKFCKHDPFLFFDYIDYLNTDK